MPRAEAETDWLERLDRALAVESPGGLLRSELSGLLDLEGYYVDQRPLGLLFGDGESFFNPRLSLFLDTQVGRHLYSLVQARFDHGFDPRLGGVAARADEYLLRWTPFDDSRLSIQVGKFATRFGAWVTRHDSWKNPFVNAPLPYENVTIVTDQGAPGSPAEFLARRALADRKKLWLPVVWGPAYTTGAAALGRVGPLDYSVEVKNASISSRPAVWDARHLDFDEPTVTGRVGFQPRAALGFGASASHGSYLLPAARATLPAGKHRGDFAQTTVGEDLGYSWRHLQLWQELVWSRFEVPRVGDANTVAYFLEGRWKLTPGLYGALRWGQQFFGDVANGVGGQSAWDRDVWRIEPAIGYRFGRHVQGKLQYAWSHQKGDRQQGEQLLAAQLTLKF